MGFELRLTWDDLNHWLWMRWDDLIHPFIRFLHPSLRRAHRAKESSIVHLFTLRVWWEVERWEFKGEFSKLGRTCSWRAQGKLESQLFVASVFVRRRVQGYLVALGVELPWIWVVGCGECMEREVYMQGFFNQQRGRARAQGSLGTVKEGGGTLF